MADTPISAKWLKAAALVKPRARFMLFGVTAKDIHKAATRLAEAEQHSK